MSSIHDKGVLAEGVAHLLFSTDHFDDFEEQAKALTLPQKELNFWACGKVIIGQQLSGKAAATIEQRVISLGASIFDPSHFLLISEPELRKCGLSSQKSAAIRGVANRLTDDPSYIL